MEYDVGWIIDVVGLDGVEIGGVMFNVLLWDWVWFGLFIEQGGVWNDEQILFVDWVDCVMVFDEDYLKLGVVYFNFNCGYVWYWWIYVDGMFIVLGVNGQMFYVDCENDIVVVCVSVWFEGYVCEYDDQSYVMYKVFVDWFVCEEVGSVEFEISVVEVF